MEYKIKELMNVNRGASPRPIIDFLTDKGYKWLKISDFNMFDRYVYNTKEHIIEEGVKKTRYLPKGTLILTNSATPGIPIFLGDDMCLHDGFLYFQNIDEEKINIKFLYYWFLFNRSKIVSQANGSVFQNLKKEIVENFIIDVPNINKQAKIVEILENINNKIELNNQINDNLLKLIDAYFDEVFVDIEHIKRADEIADITIGKTPPRAKQECFSKDDKDIKWLSISDIGKCGVYVFDTTEKLTQNAINDYNVRIIPEDTIVLSFKLTVGRVAITNEAMATNEAIAHFNLYDNKFRSYIYMYLRKFDYNKLGSTSSIATAVNSKIIKAMPIKIPDEENLERFNKIADNILKTIRVNEKEIIRLEQLRDTLLPKLMNEEIDLDKIEI